MDQLSCVTRLCQSCKGGVQGVHFCDGCGKAIEKGFERKSSSFLSQRRNAVVYSPQQAKELRQKLTLMMSSIVASGASTEEISFSSPPGVSNFKAFNHKTEYKTSWT
uniref:Uncharacterized protein n=1 Tax=Lotharella oceanica TaxID=641309 RepID=A0A7S2U5C8_9EUKA|mmetsp:Transcript_8805/g.17242  ORF Transcript_8805/g.17242 Transcript_8805/m.17242 type:complete len:107 (+) Transcript_8805:337-657(+)